MSLKEERGKAVRLLNIAEKMNGEERHKYALLKIED